MGMGVGGGIPRSPLAVRKKTGICLSHYIYISARSPSSLDSRRSRMGRRSNWTQKRRKRPDNPTTAPREDSSCEYPDVGAGESMSASVKLKPMGTAAQQLFAEWLWAPDYTPIFRLEMAVNRQLVNGQVHMQPSSYRARLKGRAAEVYDERRRLQERDQMAIMLHANNQQDWSPSMLSRSVAYWNQTSTSVQRIEGRQRRLASRPVTFEFMRMMRDCRPLPAWPRGEHVEFFVADQTYEWVGVKKHGRRSTVERHDHRGMPVALRHEVYVNSIRAHAEAASMYIRRFVFERFFPF
jgi:hypothetical protein